MEPTIFASVFAWALDPVTSGVVGNLAYDGLKKLAKPFVDRFKKFFENENEAGRYYEGLCSEKSRNPNKPHRDIEDLYESITQTTIKSSTREELTGELKAWMRENQKLIIDIRVHQHDNDFRMHIGSQSANKIINVQGTANINELK